MKKAMFGKMFTEKKSGVSIYSKGDVKRDLEMLELLKELPPKVREQILEAMRNPDFDPNELAAAIERAREELSEEDNSQHERCPWYETAQRLLILLAGAGYLVGIFVLVAWVFVRISDLLLDTTLEAWLFNMVTTRPVLTIMLLIGLFLASLVYLVIHIARRIKQTNTLSK